MATGSSQAVFATRDYPTSDGKPMAETDDHRDLMVDLIETLKVYYLASAWVYVSGNLLIYYVPGDKRRHISPDVFVVRGVAKHNRDYYLVWEEGKAPEVAVELTSKSTRREDQGRKMVIYRDILKVKEYFLFDPHQDYLKPSLQGYRLSRGEYRPIRPVAGRLPSKVMGLHLEADGGVLRLYDPAAGRWLPTPAEARQEAEAARQRAEDFRQQAEESRQQAEESRQQAEESRQQAEESRQQAEEENVRLRQELATLRRRLQNEA
jgi:Uma2 family endonuclease